MDLNIQILRAIEMLQKEAMWTTLQEYELLHFHLNHEEIFCSFQGKNVPYYGIEIFIGDNGKQALLNRLKGQFYPEYILRYRQNSIIIMVDDKIKNLQQPVVKWYEKNQIPTWLPFEKQLFVLECLGKLYEMVKLMQSKNILGKFEPDTYLSLAHDGSLQFNCFDFEDERFDAFEFGDLSQLPQNEMEIEIDLFPMEATFTEKEVVFGLFIVDRLENTMIHQELFNEEKQVFIAEVLQWYIQQLGRFKKIFVRDEKTKAYLSKLASYCNVEIDARLDAIDAIVNEMMQEENNG